jgi:acrylyl-CoA reductase (NADPH)
MKPTMKFPALMLTSESVEKADADVKHNRCLLTSVELDRDDLGADGVLVQVIYSALNYKDALAASGHTGVVRKFPLIPGIDAVGKVIESNGSGFRLGDEVLIAHAKFGTSHHGGFSSFARVPADWLVKLPVGLSLEDAAAWGTAGFTAAQSVGQLLNHGVSPESGEILVTGATGGVGVFAVQLLAKLGFSVTASTGKLDRYEQLLALGAEKVVPREEVVDLSDSPLTKSRWAGVVDCVGGTTLNSAIRATQVGGCVTACGLVSGHEVGLTVYPFILRGIVLCGIDSANVSQKYRQELWDVIGSDWSLDLRNVSQEVTLSQLPDQIERILNGSVFGRIVVRMPE